MPSKIWNKYTKLSEINSNSNSNIKTYLARIEPIIKEINIPKDYNEYYLIKEKIDNIKSMDGVIEIIEEDNKIYIVLVNNPAIISKIDELILEIESIRVGQVNTLFETSTNIEITPSLTQGEINFPVTTQDFTSPNLDQELIIPQVTTSFIPESTINNQPETTSTSQDIQNTISFNQTVGSLNYQDNQTFSPTPPGQGIPDTSIQIISSTPDTELQQISTMPETVLKPIINMTDSFFQQTSSTQEFDLQQKTTSVNSEGQQNSIKPANSQQISVINTDVDQPIITPSSFVPDPVALTNTPNANAPGTLSPPSGTFSENTKVGTIHSLKVNTRPLNAFRDEDFQRRRPIYDDYMFNDDRYRGFRFLTKLS